MNRQETNLYNDSIHKFLKIHRYLRLYANEIRSVGISGRKVGALRHLSEVGARTIGQLSDYQHISISSASEMVSSLEKLGYVRRSRSEEDNRVVQVELTAAGQEVVDKTPEGGIALLRRRLRGLEPERQRLINQALSDLVKIMEIDDRGI